MDPIADIDAIDYELILSDLEVVQNRAGRMAKAAKSGNNKGAAAEAAWLQQLADHLSAGKPARSFDFDEGDAEQQAVLHEMGLLSAKPVLYACNVGEDDLMEASKTTSMSRWWPHAPRKRAHATFPSAPKPRRISPTTLPRKRRLFWLKWALKPVVWTTSSLPAMICWA